MIISSRSGLFSSAIVLDVVMSETLPINAVARANGVRLMIFPLSFRTATPFLYPSFRTPDVTVHSQALPLVSLEVRHLLFPSFRICRLNTTPAPLG